MTATPIRTIAQLKKNLNMGPGYGGYLDLLKSIYIPFDEWKKHCSWKEAHYTRNCISSCDSYELLLMCWKKDQQSPIHTYDSQESWINVLEGSLTIEFFYIDREDLSYRLNETIVLNKGDYILINDQMGFHQVKNTTNHNAVSLHLNLGKVKQWEVFDEIQQSINIIYPRCDSYSLECVN